MQGVSKTIDDLQKLSKSSLLRDNKSAQSIIENAIKALSGYVMVSWERDVAMCVAQLKDLGYSLGEKPRGDGWISIKDKLPEEDGVVLVCFDDGKIGFGEYIDCPETNGYGFNISYLGSVVAWQPLPKPFKE